MCTHKELLIKMIPWEFAEQFKINEQLNEQANESDERNTFFHIKT